MRKDKQFSIRISEQDLETIRRKAAQAHMSQSDYPQMQLKQEAAKRMSNSLFATPNPELLVS